MTRLNLSDPDNNWFRRLMGREACAKCGHEPDRGVLTVVEPSEFRQSLSPAALALVQRPITTTVFVTLHCQTCDQRFIDDRDPMARHNGPPPEHAGHVIREETKMMQYIGMQVGVTYQMLAAYATTEEREERIRSVILSGVRRIAALINKAVEEKRVAYGSLMSFGLMRCASYDPVDRYMLVSYVGSDYTREQLNEWAGANLFVSEGELPPHEGVWDAWAAKNL